ncbi:MAG: ice-binding family protein [Ferruginibacter sp.]
MKNKLNAVVTAICLLLVSNVNFAQAPSLGTSAGFELFTTVGAVSNSGISQVTGNVGTNSGSSTGFGNVNGVMHDNDGASGQAAADLLIAYNQLNAAIPTFFPAPLLGNGDTLVSGVYHITAVATLNSNLYLDAKGNPNAVFIFQIEAAFSANANAKVKLINGALACNVFWKIEGGVNIAAKVFMRGTIVAHNAAINMNTSDTLEGRALSIAGAVAVDGVLAYIPTGCGSVILTGPPAPAFASSGCFAIFSANGSVTNSGITHITGDVGTNVGLTVGYDPLYVTGFIHPIPDGYTSAAAADLLSAYNYLNVLPNDIELLYPAQFGSNLVLTPHTYLMNGAATFTDSLFLNALGNVNAVFVIKIKGALSTSTFAKVLLINGTRAKNVYWVVDGATNINDNSVFNGTIVCYNGAITMNTGTTLNGRALTTGGSLSTAAVIATSPSGDCNTLPVNWLYFRGKPVQKSILLEWGTTNEVNNGFFTIEKSMDGQRFETITTVTVTKGIENSGHQYSFTDLQPYSNTYYRISQTDKDAQKKFYKTIQVKLGISQGITVLPYVQGNQVYILSSGAKPGDGSIGLYSVDGKKISSQKILLTKEVSTYKIAKTLSKGMYLLYIESHGENVYNGKVMIQ